MFWSKTNRYADLLQTNSYKNFQTIRFKGKPFCFFDPEVTAKLAKNKELRWKEVPITYNPRTVDEGKKIRWRDGFRALFSILKYGLF